MEVKESQNSHSAVLEGCLRCVTDLAAGLK